MPLSYNQYTGDGTTRAFNLDFDYIAKDHVEVRVDGSPVPYTWLDTYRVQAITAPASGAIVDVRRVTPRDEVLVEYQDGSVLVETDLNLATIQTFFLAQEAFDQGEASLAVTPDGHYSAGLRRITLALDPVDDRDVVTKQWAENTTNTNVGQAIAARNAAQAARTGAETAQTGAQTARTGAETARTGAETAKAAAETAQGNAASSAAAALADKNTVAADKAIVAADKATVAADKATTLGYRNDAQSAKTAAETARDAAQEWADKEEDSPISPGVFSARHWAAKALAAASSVLGDLANLIHGAVAKTTPVDADEFIISDSAASWGSKKLSWSSVKETIKSYFDGFYVAISGGSNLGGYSSALQDLGDSNGRTIVVEPGTSNFKILHMDGNFTLEAPSGYTQNFSAVIFLWEGTGVMTTSGFTKVHGKITPGKNHLLTITCVEAMKVLTIMEAN